jgi:hypothetical protein
LLSLHMHGCILGKAESKQRPGNDRPTVEVRCLPSEPRGYERNCDVSTSWEQIMIAKRIFDYMNRVSYWLLIIAIAVGIWLLMRYS